MKNNVPRDNLDYVKIYSSKLREDSKYFKQHKMLIDSQLKTSKLLFAKRFGTGNQFKTNAREYLRRIKNL